MDLDEEKGRRQEGVGRGKRWQTGKSELEMAGAWAFSCRMWCTN